MSQYYRELIDQLESKDAPFMTRGEVAELFGVSAQTITNWSKRGEFPKPFSFGRIRRWEKAEIIAYLQGKEESD